MKLQYAPVKIAKSVTLLITSPVERALRFQTAGWLLRREKDAEQAVFVAWDGDAPRLETADGVLSVNGTMALTAWLALRNDLPTGETWSFPLALSGGSLSLPSAVTPVPTCCMVTVTMPRPEQMEEREFPLPGGSVRLPVVDYPGVSHIIVPAGTIQRTAAPELLRRWSEGSKSPNLGLLFWNKDAHLMDPLIYDRASGMAAWRQSCGSGAAAVGTWLAQQGLQDLCLSLKMPGGAMAVTAVDGSVTVSAPVEVGRSRSVDLVF